MQQTQVTYSVWPTAWGPMGAAANARGLVRVVLPHYAMADLRAMLAFELPEAVEDPKAFEPLAALTRQYFNAQPTDFSGVLCDIPAETTFTGKALRICRTIPYGQTRSYSWLAQTAGNPQGARAAAAAMGKNCLPLVIPCHRVVYTGGKLGGYSAPGGVEQKRRMLTLEGVK